MKASLFALLLTSCTLVSWAQTNPQEGFVITLQNDTLQGIIDYRTGPRNARLCDFKKNGTQDFVTYRPGEIDSYGIHSSRAYYKTMTTAIEGKDSTFFAEYLVRGGMNLYRLASNNDRDLYILQKNDGESISFYGEDGTITSDKEERRNRILPIYNLLRDSNRATQKLWESTITRSTITQIAQLYNEDVKSDIPTDVFTKSSSRKYKASDGPKEKYLHIMILAGMGYQMHKSPGIGNSGDLTMNGFQPRLSIGANYHLARFASGLYIEGLVSWSNIGVKNDSFSYQYNQYAKGTYTTELTGSNLHIEVGPSYRFGKDLKVQPLVRAGVDFNHAFGLDFKATSDSQNYASQFELNSEISDKRFFVGYYVGVGAAYPLSKGAILLYIDYNDTNANTSLKSFDVRIGYEF